MPVLCYVEACKRYSSYNVGYALGKALDLLSHGAIVRAADMRCWMLALQPVDDDCQRACACMLLLGRLTVDHNRTLFQNTSMHCDNSSVIWMQCNTALVQ